ncbi:glycosyltransferase family 10 domain-containing protein [Brachyspira alvinipulli]|uniref:glycosyltransferase family 10 domain-containing protein n=1 Tax=Brachyspira alvinipulli TaxID=84379 RepID=UPI0004B67959|nr:glycosyltransferase family 10 [Brachyspira alvinipulli]
MEDSKKYIDKILWLIPFKKFRYFLRVLFYNILDIKEIKDDVKTLKTELFDLRNEIRSINKNVNNCIFFMKESNHYQDISKGCDYFLIFQSILSKKNIKLLFTKYDPDIELFYVYGDRKNVISSKAKIKIFYTEEPVQVFRKDYNDNCIDLCDLSLGFNHISNSNYIRFPLWIRWNFNIIELNKDNIYKRILELNNAKFKKTKFASLIATWGGANNLRGSIYDSLSKIDKVSCPSKFLHNDDSLKNDFNDSKYEYLKQFKFNICPENCIEDGYITEKLFDAFKTGCIPIWNGDKNLEGDIVNKNAVLYWDIDSDNKELIKEIKSLHENDDLYDKFVSQQRFITDNALEYIYGQIKLLHEKIEELANKLI